MSEPTTTVDLSAHADLIPIMNLLLEESDRGKVLIVATWFEEQLRKILHAFMREGTDPHVILERGNAPLGTFSGRIRTCYCLGLLTPSESHDLHLVRKIRNDFAHDFNANFGEASILGRVRALKLRFLMKDAIGNPVRVEIAGEWILSTFPLMIFLNRRPERASVYRKLLDLTKLQEHSIGASPSAS